MNATCPVCGNQLPEQAAVCPHCGFRPQGATQSFQPIAFGAEPASAPVEPDPAKATLSFIRGPQTGVAFELEPGTLSVGRNPQCDIFLNDMTVSRQHANLVHGEKGWEIHDANSFNGVWVNNESIDVHVLQDGDLLQIGAFCLRFSSK